MRRTKKDELIDDLNLKLNKARAEVQDLGDVVEAYKQLLHKAIEDSVDNAKTAWHDCSESFRDEE